MTDYRFHKNRLEVTNQIATAHSKEKTILRRGEDLMSKGTTYTIQNIQFSLKKNNDACKEIREYGPFTEKNEQKLPKEAHTLNLLGRNFKSTFLNMLKELKEIIDEELKETRRMVYEQRECQ